MGERYEIKEKIGQGAAGSVYKALDTKLDRIVAIKKLRHSDTEEREATAGSQGTPESLLREAKALSAYQHPNIVTVHDVGEDADGPFVVMELLNGSNLDDVVKAAPLPLDDFYRIAGQALEGLAAAHGRDMLHRDIKSSNLMLVWDDSGGYNVKLLDFGLAKISSGASLQTVDQSGSVLGTINFMAPEQFERSPIDQRADLYSLGCVFYHALTQKHAFDGETGAEVMASHLQHRNTPLREIRPELPEALGEWLSQLYARKPENRFASAREALSRLKEIQTAKVAKPSETKKPTGSPVSLTLPIPETEPAKPKLPWIISGIVTAILLAAAVFFLVQESSSDVAATASLPVEKADFAEVDASKEIFSPFEIAKIEDREGDTIVLEGTIERVGESKSGKTRYLNFSWPPGRSVPVSFRIDPGNDDQLSLSTLRQFVDRPIRATGEVDDVFGMTYLKVESLSDIKITE